MYDLIIEDATIVSSEGRQVADIALKNGRIAYVGPRPMGGARERVNAIGRFLIPGIIDSQVSFPETTEAEPAWASETRAAVSGGVTTVLEIPPAQTAKAIASRRRLAKKHSACSYGFWGSSTDPVVGQKMMDQGAVGLSIDLSAETSDRALRRLFSKTRGMLGFHVEDNMVLRERREALGDSEDHNALRPPAAAAAGVQRLITLVREFERPAHIFQLSTASELLLLDPIGGDLPISTAVGPAHLSLSVDQHEGLGHLLKSNPPVRTETDRRALWTALKRNRISAIASAHTPIRQAAKLGAYADVPPGLPGVETTFSVMLSAVQHGRLSLERLVQLLSEAPARILGLANKGRIQTGYDADLVLFSESEVARLRPGALMGSSGWSPYLGRELAPKPELVLVGGVIVSRRGELTGAAPRVSEVVVQRG